MAEISDTLPTINFTAQIVALAAQVQENSNKFMTVEAECVNLRVENSTL